MINYYYECQCRSEEHRVVWWSDDGSDIDWEPMLGHSVFLGDYPKIWSRIWHAIKYVFGHKSIYGHFDCFLMKPEDTDKMIAMLQEFQEKHKNYREKKTLLS